MNLDKRTENSDKGMGNMVSPHLFDVFLLPHELFHYKKKKKKSSTFICIASYII